jgi:hypothetical protein
MSAKGNVVPFLSVADHVLDTEERLGDLVDCLVELGQRLDTLEAIAVENAGTGGDPLAAILARLDAFSNRLDRLELRQRRPVPLTVIQNHRLDPDERQVFLELQTLFNKLDRGLKQHATTIESRLSHYTSQFHMIRQRLAAVEKRKGA